MHLLMEMKFNAVLEQIANYVLEMGKQLYKKMIIHL